MKLKRVAVALSGGVDSAVTAYLLKKNGYDVIGLTMKLHDDCAEHLKISNCFGADAAENAELVKKLADKLSFPYYVIDLGKEYKETVLDYFCAEYMCGRTPNPCVICNSRIKFSALIEKAEKNGINFDLFATGHYVRTEYDAKSNRYLLKKGFDKNKDQSYFLWGLNQKQLSRTIFPIGDYIKQDIRKIANEIGLLDIAEKKDSQDFLKSTDYSELFKNVKIKHGPIYNTEGKYIGEHKGIIYYTVGQRKHIPGGSREPLYVNKIDTVKNSIIVGTKSELLSDELTASHLNWISINQPDKPIHVKAKIRQQHCESDAMLFPSDNGKIIVKFDKPQLSITAGQSIVFYDGDIIIGGGIIISRK